MSGKVFQRLSPFLESYLNNKPRTVDILDPLKTAISFLINKILTLYLDNLAVYFKPIFMVAVCNAIHRILGFQGEMIGLVSFYLS